MIRIYVAVVAIGLAALLLMDRWAGWLMETNAEARVFVEGPVFTVVAILGGVVVSLCSFGAMVLILFPRPSGRTQETGGREQ